MFYFLFSIQLQLPGSHLQALYGTAPSTLVSHPPFGMDDGWKVDDNIGHLLDGDGIRAVEQSIIKLYSYSCKKLTCAGGEATDSDVHL